MLFMGKLIMSMALWPFSSSLTVSLPEATQTERRDLRPIPTGMYLGVLAFESTSKTALIDQTHGCKKITWLVVGFNPSEKYAFVSWDDDIPNIWKNKKCSKPPFCHFAVCMLAQFGERSTCDPVPTALG